MQETTKLRCRGYEQDDYVRDADVDSRNLADMAEEFATVRRATIQLFRPLNETEWLRHRKANQNDVSVRALAYIIAGHELHHMGVLRSGYLQSSEDPRVLGFGIAKRMLKSGTGWRTKRC